MDVLLVIGIVLVGVIVLRLVVGAVLGAVRIIAVVIAGLAIGFAALAVTGRDASDVRRAVEPEARTRVVVFTARHVPSDGGPVRLRDGKDRRYTTTEQAPPVNTRLRCRVVPGVIGPARVSRCRAIEK